MKQKRNHQTVVAPLRWAICAALAFLFFGAVHGQISPGGITAHALHLWLKADQGTNCSTNNCEVNTWDDQSAQGNNAVSGPGSDVNLSFGQMNYNPGIDITNNNYVAYPLPSITDSFTIFVVFQTTESSNPNNNDWWTHPAVISGEMSGGVQDYGLTLDDGRVKWSRNGSDQPVLVSLNDANGNVDDGFNNMVSVRRQAVDGACEMWINGIVQANGNMITGLLNSPDSLHMAGTPAPGNGGEMDILYGEVVTYAGFMPGGERQKVHSYLALKYGLTMRDDYVDNTGTVVFTDEAGDTYDGEVVGIGRDDDTGLNQLISTPAHNPDGMTICNGTGFNGTLPTHNGLGGNQNPNPLQDGQYLIAGFEDANVGFSQPFDGVANSRMDRVYRIQETGDIGKVTLFFDGAEFGLAQGRVYHLAYGTDLTFNFSDEVIELRPIPGSNSYYAEVDFPANAHRYFSLVRMDNIFPRPGFVDIGTNQLSHWFDANYGTNCTGNPCALTNPWYDLGNNGQTNNGTPAGTVELRDGVMNFNNAVYTNPGGNVSIPLEEFQDFCGFVVFRTGSGSGTGSNWENHTAIMSAGSDPANFGDEYGLTINGNGEVVWSVGTDNGAGDDDSVVEGAIDFRDNSAHVVFFDRDVNGGSAPIRISVDGRTIQSFNTNNNDDLNDSPTIRLGRHVTNNGGLDAEFGEFIMFDDLISNNERLRTQTYLGLKYGVTLFHNYIQTNVGNTLIYDINTGQDQEIIGIGADLDTRFDQRISVPATNSDGLTLMNGPWMGALPARNFDVECKMTDNTFLIVGNTGESYNFSASFDGTPSTRMSRVYKAQETGVVDTVTLFLPGTEFTQFATGGPYSLVISSDTVFTSTDEVIPLVTVGSDYYVMADFNGTEFFTFISQLDASPGGVDSTLQLWVRGDLNLNTAAPVSWQDISGTPVNTLNDLGMANFAATTGLVNFNPSLVVNTPLDSFGTSGAISAQTIFAVGRVTSSGNGSPYYMGFTNGPTGIVGQNAPSPAVVDKGATGTWLGGASSLYRNSSLQATTADISEWNVLSMLRVASFNSDYFLGPPPVSGTNSFATYEFAEVVVYDALIDNTGRERIESYLAVRYGLTLSQAYRASDYTLIRGVGSYNNDIAVIGRDDDSFQNQKQSRSVNTDGVVTIAVGSVAANNAANTNNLPDLQFISIGNNDGAACFTSLEVGAIPEPNHLWKLDREWRIDRTAGYVDDLVVQFDYNHPGFDLPAPPVGAIPGTGGVSYYLLLDDDGDFTTGSSFVNFTSSTANTMTAILSNAQYTTTPYFSVGVLLDSTNYGLQDLCNADPVTFFSSYLTDAGLCARLVFNDGTQTFELYESDVIVTDGAANCLDTWQWQVDDAFASYDVYTVSVETGPNTGPCDATNTYSSAPAYVVGIDSLTIGVNGTTTFSYPTGGNVCVGAANLIPDTSAISRPGQFYLQGSTNPMVTTQNLLASQVTGELLVYPGTIGAHNICYGLPGNCSGGPTCDSVVVIQPVPSVLNYSATTACSNDPTPLTTTTTPATGQYSSVPALLSPNFTATGEIIPSSEAPGTYQVTFTPTPGNCELPAMAIITIDAVDSALFSFPDSVVCLNQTFNPTPSIFHLPAGGTFGCGNCGGITLDINAGTGEIDLTNSTPGFFLVEYQANGICQATGRTTIRLTDQTPINTFGLLPTYCEGTGNQTIALSPNTPTTATFVEDLSGNLSFIPGPGGNWRLQTTGAPVGGPYPVMFSYTNADGCVTRQVSTTTIGGADSTRVSYATDAFCVGNGNSNPSPVFSQGLGGGVFSSTPVGTYLNASTGEIDLSQVPLNTDVVVSYTNAVGSCISTTEVGPDTLRFYGAPDPTFFVGANGVVDQVCEGTTAPLSSTGLGNGLDLQVFVGDSLIFSPPGSNIQVAPLDGDITYTVYNILANANLSTCRDTAVDYFTVLPNGVVDFSYGPIDTLCSGTGDPNPVPAQYGTGGGTYSSNTAVFVDPNTGQLDLSATQLNGTTHFIVYTTGGTCPSVDSIEITVFEAANASFDYISSVICNSQGTMAVQSLDSAGGVFSCLNCAGTGASVNPSTGLLNVANVNNDVTLQIEYSFASAGFCGQSNTEQVTVDAFNNALAIDFAPVDSFCPQGAAIPIVTGIDSISEGTFQSQFGLTYLDIDSGIVNLSSSVFGVHTVSYRLNGICSEVASTQIFIRSQDRAGFQYPQAVVCEGVNDTLVPALDDSASIGIFTVNTAQNDDTLDIDPLTGIINVENSTPGVFFIVHTSGGQCVDVDSTTFSIALNPTIGNLGVSPGSTICGDDTVTIRINAGGIPRFIVDGNIIPNTPELVLTNPYDGQLITAIITSTDNCADTGYVTITQNAIPDGDVTTWPNAISGDEEIEIIIQSLTDVTEFIWSATASDNVTLAVVRDTTIMVNTGEDAPITNSVELDSDFNPGNMLIAIVPTANGCVGDTIFLPIDINPNNEAIFIPGVFTPNGDTKNDTWQIQWRADIGDPENYVIELYNRTGGLVYTMEGLVDTWDGESLPDGVYWYLLKDPAGETIQAGGLTIRRR